MRKPDQLHLNPYSRGKQAFLNAVRITQNPFRDGPNKSREEWTRGWNDAYNQFLINVGGFLEEAS